MGSVDRLAMTVNVQASRFLPEMSCPFSQSSSEVLCTTSLGQMNEKPLGVRVSIGSRASSEQAEGIASVAAQIARAMQANGTQQP
jgi:hypothetical protein